MNLIEGYVVHKNQESLNEIHLRSKKKTQYIDIISKLITELYLSLIYMRKVLFFRKSCFFCIVFIFIFIF